MFQSNGFQSSGFQMYAYNFPQGTGWDKHKLWDWPKKKKEIEERIESLPAEVVDAVEIAVRIDKREERERVFLEKLEGVEAKFSEIYADLLEQYYQILLDEELENQLRLVQQMEDDDLALILLLSS